MFAECPASDAEGAAHVLREHLNRLGGPLSNGHQVVEHAHHALVWRV